MKNLIVILLLMLAVVTTGTAQNKESDSRLKQFVIVLNNVYTPEITIEDAIKLGFSINDYNKFLKYIDAINVDKTNPLELYENNFLGFFLEYQNGKLFLDLSFNQAIKAGASSQGYFKMLQLTNDYNKSLTKEDMQELMTHLKKAHAEMIVYTTKNHNKTANDYIEDLKKESAEKFKYLERLQIKR